MMDNKKRPENKIFKISMLISVCVHIFIFISIPAASPPKEIESDFKVSYTVKKVAIKKIKKQSTLAPGNSVPVSEIKPSALKAKPPAQQATKMASKPQKTVLREKDNRTDRPDVQNTQNTQTPPDVEIPQPQTENTDRETNLVEKDSEDSSEKIKIGGNSIFILPVQIEEINTAAAIEIYEQCELDGNKLPAEDQLRASLLLIKFETDESGSVSSQPELLTKSNDTVFDSEIEKMLPLLTGGIKTNLSTKVHYLPILAFIEKKKNTVKIERIGDYKGATVKIPKPEETEKYVENI